MVVHPINRDDEEAQRIAQEYRPEIDERGEAATDRCFEIEHHDGDDDRDHAVGEGLEPARTVWSRFMRACSHVPYDSQPSSGATTSKVLGASLSRLRDAWRRLRRQ